MINDAQQAAAASESSANSNSPPVNPVLVVADSRVPPTNDQLTAYFGQCQLPTVPFRLSHFETVVDVHRLIDTLLTRLSLGGAYAEICRDHLTRLKTYIESPPTPSNG